MKSIKITLFLFAFLTCLGVTDNISAAIDGFPRKPTSTRPRSGETTGITMIATNDNKINAYFDFAFGVVNVQINKTTGQPVYSTKVNTDAVTYLSIDCNDFPEGSYIITYTDAKGVLIADFDLVIE